MFKSEVKSELHAGAGRFIEDEIKAFVRDSSLNRMPSNEDYVIFDEPLVGFASGDDPLFTEYKTIIAPSHLTPNEAMTKAHGKRFKNMPTELSVISWILPITAETRESNRAEVRTPSRLWSHTRWYGEKFNEALRKHVVEVLTGMKYMAVAPMAQSYFKTYTNEKGPYSNWSERHIAYAAGLGTFSLSDGFITERGIAHRCGSVVTELMLPVSPRTAEGPYSNCLYYVDGSCTACIDRCPAEAITEQGHDKVKCQAYLSKKIGYLLKEYKVGVAGCGLCQAKVPCEFTNPVKKKRKKK